jgi:acyl phosphate:glycerol-3-phosphate acyltransferase
MSLLQLILFIPLLVGAYLAGAVPFGLVIGKVFFDVDIREHGSGNVGTTNAFRVLGTKAGVAVLACDMLKGYVPALAASLIFGPWATIFIASAPVAGHMYSIFLRGSGGKGIATGSAVALALVPWIYVVVLLIWIAVLLAGRMVSLASLVAAVALAVLTVVTGQPLPYGLAAVLVLALVIYAHRGNIDRMIHHREPRVTFPWSAKPPAVPGAGQSGGGE